MTPAKRAIEVRREAKRRERRNLERRLQTLQKRISRDRALLLVLKAQLAEVQRRVVAAPMQETPPAGYRVLARAY